MSSKLRVSLNGAPRRALFTLFQSSYKNFKGKFVKVRASTRNPTLLDGFPLYWTREPKFQSAWRLEDLSPKDQGIYQFLLSLKVVFDTSYLISKGYILGALKAYTSTPHSPLLVKITLLPLVNNLFIFFAGTMLSHISKAELADMAKKMWAAATVPKDSLTQKKEASVTITQAPTEQDKETTSTLIFKRKRKASTPSTEHSHSDGRALHPNVVPSDGQAPPKDIIVIQE